MKLTPDDKQADSLYLYYLFSSRAFQNKITSQAIGSSVPGFNLGQLRSTSILLPPLPIQRQIAAILSAFDDKIELNRQMNRTLEAMARALFQSWFVDFDPVRAKMRGEQPEGMDAETAALFPDELAVVEGREVPKGWMWVAFDSLVQILGGGTPKTSNADFWGGTIPWYSVVDVPNDGDVWVLDTSKHITEAGLANSPTKLLPVGTTIISARGTVGKLALTAVPMTMNQSCYGLFPCDKASTYFTYLSTLHAIHELKGKVHGAVFDTITKETLSTVTSISPAPRIVAAFEQTSGDLMSQILGNLRESAYLSTLRDALLPRLLSGEVDVSEWAEMSGEALEMV